VIIPVLSTSLCTSKYIWTRNGSSECKQQGMLGPRDKPLCLIKADKPGLNIHCILSVHHFPHQTGW